jgi:uncharacterized damage-inducible protein DinB
VQQKEADMKMTELFLGELDREAAVSRRTLAEVPDGHYDWKPHERSMPFGYLATMVASMPAWVAMVIEQDELDIDPPGGSKHKQPEMRTAEELMAGLDGSVAGARKVLAATSEEHLMKPWRFLVSGREVSALPRHIALRDSVFNHWVHHRGQLTVYLRLLDARIPSIYGPSGDEKV